MKPSKQEFLNNPPSITLIGMSGVGKTYISQILAKDGWNTMSCDYDIGTKHLSKDLQETLDIKEPITVENISCLSRFVGQVGDPEYDGLPLQEFLRRQNLYYRAECRSIEEAVQKVNTNARILVDSTGSLCEIKDDKLIDALGQQTLFVYLKASEIDQTELISRAEKYPKPLFFPPDKFESWLTAFLQASNLNLPAEMRPNAFSRWVFPQLLFSRLPKYQNLADQYGVTIPAAEFQNISTSDEFMAIVGSHLS